MTRPNDEQTAMEPPMKWNAWGDPAAGQTAVRRHPNAAQAGARDRGLRHGGTRSRAGPLAAVRAVASRSRRARGDRRCRLLRHRRPRPATARRRQVDAGPVAPQGLRCAGRTRRRAATRRRQRGRRDPAVLRRPQHRRRPVRRRHQRGRRLDPTVATSRPSSRWTCGGSTNCTHSTRSPGKPSWAPD